MPAKLRVTTFDLKDADARGIGLAHLKGRVGEGLARMRKSREAGTSLALLAIVSYWASCSMGSTVTLRKHRDGNFTGR